jgi:hypothetical protein
MNSTIAESMNDNININSTIAGSVNDNININSTIAESRKRICADFLTFVYICISVIQLSREREPTFTKFDSMLLEVPLVLCMIMKDIVPVVTSDVREQVYVLHYHAE